jgi:hypothetical protein
LRAVERDAAEVEQARQSWRAAAAGIAPGRLVFVDESAALTNLARPYGRGPRGERARGAVPCGRWERVTVVGALGAGGVVAAMSVPRPPTGRCPAPTWGACCCPSRAGPSQTRRS